MKSIKFYCSSLFILFFACSGGGKYNYDIRYHPLKSEKSFYEKSEDLGYEEIRKDPLKYRGANLGWFGVVKNFETNKDGTITLLLEYRVYQPRHLCEDSLEKSTCRVTVSEKSFGTFTTNIKPSPEDRDGKFKVNFKSLLKIYGTPTGEYNEEGGPVLECHYYRHWPAGTYVTTRASEVMRQ